MPMDNDNTITINLFDGSMDDWIKQLNQCLLYNGSCSKVIIDLGNISFLSPGKTVSLACLIEEYVLKGISEIQFQNEKFDINRYLKNIRFFEYWTKGFNRNQFIKLTVDTTFSLWQVKADMIDHYATQAQKYFQNAYFQGKNLDVLNIALAEVFNNIFDHSESKIDGYVITQCYPKTEQIITSICDFGIGIPEKINELWVRNGKDKINDNEALRAALFNRISSQSTPHNRGFGLANLYQSVRNLNGSIEIRSNKGVLMISADGKIKSYLSTNYLKGTLVIITLEKRFLPDIEEELLDDGFIL